jgi:hypothetical protein
MQPDDPVARPSDAAAGAAPTPTAPAHSHRRGHGHPSREDLEPPWALFLVGLLLILLTFALPDEVRGELQFSGLSHLPPPDPGVLDQIGATQVFLQYALFGGMLAEAALWIYYHFHGHAGSGARRPPGVDLEHPGWCEIVFRPLVWTTTWILTFWLVASLVLLIGALDTTVHPGYILRSGTILWITNVLAFARWYWLVDRLRPHFAAHRRRRDVRSRSEVARHRCDAAHRRESGDGPSLAFWFPQMADEAARATGHLHWQPGFMDYLFLAFNTSTALSPTDTAVLSRWAKMMMMFQALISLTLIVIVFARAVNTLPGGRSARTLHPAVSAAHPGRG